MTDQQKQIILAKLKILKKGGPQLLLVYNILDAFYQEIIDVKQREIPLNGEDGKDGQPGHTPTVEELLALIKPLIPPAPKNGEPGHSPSLEEFRTLISSMIPEVKNGATPTKQDLVDIMQPIVASFLEIKTKEFMTMIEEKFKALPVKTRDLPSISLFGGGRSGGSPKMEIIADGQALGQDIRKIYFLGNVSGTRNADGVVSIIFSAAAGHTFAYDETPSGLLNSSNLIYTLAHSPSPVASLILTMNGQVLTAGGVDYTLSGATITLINAPDPTDILRAKYYEY